MKPTVLTSDAKEALRKAIRGLRARLRDHLGDAVRSEYRLDLDAKKAKLPEARARRRERLDGWLDEETRSALADRAGAGDAEKKAKRGTGKAKKAASAGAATGALAAAKVRERLLDRAIMEAAHTLVNRLVLLRILEHHGLVDPPVVTGGTASRGYEQEFIHYAGPLGRSDTRGLSDLFEAVFAELALELPGLYGPVGLTPLFPVPAKALYEVIDALNDPALDSAWGDDTTLGWVYQYWNDPEREALDAKIAGGGKIEPHEIASKTQMFTERYMVEWLLENSLGLTWLSICKKNGWTADAEAVLPVLDARRADWRKKREAGEVALDALMPIEGGLESAWKYYVPQPLPDDATKTAPASIREVKLLDPACGSGHFLVIAFGLLARMYDEEARHRGETWAARDVAESILANNLHGIDIDPRAIQIAAAALWLRAKLHAPGARFARMNLVAPAFGLASLPKNDPALATLYAELHALGVPRETTEALVESLRGVDHLGTLLRVDRAIAAMVEGAAEDAGPLFGHAVSRQRAELEEKVSAFLDAHAAEADLGLRLEGEQLAAGLRFVRMVREGTYDVVVGNPPYQGTTKTVAFDYVLKNYAKGKADLYAAFLERGLELVKPGGLSALLTMRGWMFIGQFAALREGVVGEHRLRMLGDLDRGAFEDVPDEVLATVMSIVQRALPDGARSIAVQPTPLDDRSRDSGRTSRKRAGLLAQVGRHEFDAKAFAVIEGEPIVYWWGAETMGLYRDHELLGVRVDSAVGLQTSDNTRFVRTAWELGATDIPLIAVETETISIDRWAPFIMGAGGASWIEPVTNAVNWKSGGLEIRTFVRGERLASRPQNIPYYFRLGVSITTIGGTFGARAHRFRSIFGDVGASFFPFSRAELVCLLNSTRAKNILSSLNPTIHFTVGDAGRLPLWPVPGAAEIFQRVEDEFALRERSREASLEFVGPGQDSWEATQRWAQAAVDRAPSDDLPAFPRESSAAEAEAIVSFSIGVALGRFGANGDGILDTAPPDALPAGILFIGPHDTLPDSTSHPAFTRIADAWAEHGPAILDGKKQSLREWLRRDFFAHHKAVYENRPIYFPLSSENKSFVAWTSIHRWTDRTLPTLLADHLHPVLRQLDGEIADLNATRASSDKKTAIAAGKRYDTVKRLRDELADFIAAVTECAERGAPPTDGACPPRAADATFHMDLDDGVMINSAALWPLLSPQWNDPKKWWKQLCLAEGKKDYDWAHLSRRYFPARVDAKCEEDPSLAVAHGCFWKYHPAKAFAWELRLKDEIRPDFTIDEDGSDAARAAFLEAHPDEAAALEEKEAARRARKARASDEPDSEPPEEADDPPSAEADGADEGETR